MKKIMLLTVIFLGIIVSGYAQDKLKIGDMKNGKLLITNEKALKTYFMNSLEQSGTLSRDPFISYAPEKDRLFLYYQVSANADKISNIGILLVIRKNEVFIEEGDPETESAGPGGGGSLEVLCHGTCNVCVPNITWAGGWMPIVYCDCKMGEGECFASVKVVISIQIGL